MASAMRSMSSSTKPRLVTAGVPSRMPLVWNGPGIHPNGCVDEPASLLDIPATLLSLAGAAPLEQSDGHDLSDYLGGKGPYPRTLVSAGLGEWRAVSDGRWKLVEGFRTDRTLSQLQFGSFVPSEGRAGMLYDLQEDPREVANLWFSHSAERERLRAAI